MNDLAHRGSTTDPSPTWRCHAGTVSAAPRSRFGGRLEPCFRLDLVLHRGRGDLATVSAAETVAGYQALRSSADGIAAGARACDSVLRLLDSVEPNPAAYNLLCRYLELTDTACRTPAPGAASVAASTGAPAAAE